MAENITYVGQAPSTHGGRKLNRYFRKEARRVLFAADNYYKSVLSHLICGMFCGGFLYMTFYVPDIVRIVFSGVMSEEARKLFSATLNTVLILLFSFFLFMFFSGVFMLAADMKDEPDSVPGAPETADLSKMLTPLASGVRFRFFASLFIILALELSLSVLPSVFIFRYLSGAGIGAFASFLIKAAAVSASAFLSLFFIFLLLPLPFILENVKGIGVLHAYRESASIAVRGFFRCFSLLLSFIPHLLLSVLSFGVLFFAYVLPYMTLSMTKAGEYLYYSAITERNTIKNEQA